MAENFRESELHFERIVFFSDAVFAIAITLLALEIRLPEIDPENVAVELPQAILGLIPHILVFGLSFLSIGLYWVAHHRIFRHVTRYDYALIWLNLLFLLGVAFIPVPTAVFGEYPNQPSSEVFYAVALAVVGILEWVLWRYISHGWRFIHRDLSGRFIQYFGLRALAMPVAFLVSIPLLIAFPDYGKWFWVTGYLALVVLRRLFPEEDRQRGPNVEMGQ